MEKNTIIISQNVLTQYVKCGNIDIGRGGEDLDKQKIADKLIKLRGDKSREQVAVDLGISYSAIVAYELGERVPRDEIKIKIANYYGVKVGELFFSP